MTELKADPDRRRMMRGGVALAAALALAALAGGCIRSRVEISSEPSGAEVTWLGKPYGATPVTIPFTWYWHYDLALVKPGYKRLETDEYFRTPPWFLMPFDLFAEILPVPIRDTRHRRYTLEPLTRPETAPEVRELNPLSLPGAPSVNP